jgi:hypothetical protein
MKTLLRKDLFNPGFIVNNAKQSRLILDKENVVPLEDFRPKSPSKMTDEEKI